MKNIEPITKYVPKKGELLFCEGKWEYEVYNNLACAGILYEYRAEWVMWLGKIPLLYKWDRALNRARKTKDEKVVYNLILTHRGLRAVSNKHLHRKIN